MKIYQRKTQGESGITIRIEATLKNVKQENLVLMNKDITYRQKFERPPKEIKVIEQTSKNSDVIYMEMDLPFPLTNRDFVQKRLFVNNKEDPELTRQLGLWNWDHKYNAIMIQSTEREEYPEKSKPIRGETKMIYLLLEEDPRDATVVKYKMILDQDMKGDIPKLVKETLGEKMPKRMMTDILKTHKKLFN